MPYHDDIGHVDYEVKTVRIELPTINVECPHCTKEDDCSGNAFTPSECSYVYGEGKFYCDHCERWTTVILE